MIGEVGFSMSPVEQERIIGAESSGLSRVEQITRFNLEVGGLFKDAKFTQKINDIGRMCGEIDDGVDGRKTLWEVVSNDFGQLRVWKESGKEPIPSQDCLDTAKVRLEFLHPLSF